jgi:hypothetical protein
LNRDEYDELCDLLDTVSIERASIADVMGFALDHSEMALDIVSIIVKSMVKPSEDANTPMAYLARLYVISDLLHNSTAPKKNASLFRTQFEEHLPEIMEALNDVLSMIVGRMSFNTMKDKVDIYISIYVSYMIYRYRSNDIYIFICVSSREAMCQDYPYIPDTVHAFLSTWIDEMMSSINDIYIYINGRRTFSLHS